MLGTPCCSPSNNLTSIERGAAPPYGVRRIKMKRSTRMMLMSSGSNRRYNDGRSYETTMLMMKFRDRRGPGGTMTTVGMRPVLR